MPLVDAGPASGSRAAVVANVLGDRGYDAERKIQRPLRKRRIEPVIARRNTEHGRGLGKLRSVL